MIKIGETIDTGQVEEPVNLSESSSTLMGDTVVPAEDETPIINAGFTIKELKNTYLFGIDLTDFQGNPFPDSLLASYINSAISATEALFDICLEQREIVDEPHDYERNDYMNWGYIQLWKRPIMAVKSLKLMYGTRPSFEIPTDWLKIDKMSGKIQMFPSSGNSSALIITQSGAIFGLSNMFDYAPQMWSVDYTAGMDETNLPSHLKEYIYKKATISILQVWGDLLNGAGIASSSVSIDGLSQSIGTTKSGIYGGSAARIEECRKDIETLTAILRQAYAGIRMVVL